jgi:hypothetical protein
MITPSGVPEKKDTVADLPRYLATGWRVVSDGPSGVQIEGPKVMATKDKWCLWIGILTSWLGVGLLLILVALVDYYALTKAPQKFLRRE